MKNFEKILSILLSVGFIFAYNSFKSKPMNLNVSCDQAVIDAISGNGSSNNNTAQPATPAAQQPAASTPNQGGSTSNPGQSTDDPSGGNKEPVKAPDKLTASSTKEEVVAKYIEVYNNTKATGTFVGQDSMECTDITIEGKGNSAVKKLADGLMGTDTSLRHQLCPFTDDNPGTTCATTADDIMDYQFTDNGDGTATIRLDVYPTQNSRRFQDAAGNMFNVMEDLAGTLANVSAISWSEGDANSNVVLTSSGYCVITYDTTTNMMTSAEYVLITDAEIQHVNVLILRNKSATAQFKYVMSYPA